MLGRDIYEVGDKKRRGPAHILAVEDQESIRRLIQVNLERAGYRVSTASNVASARDLLARDLPDLVILDSTLPLTEGAPVALASAFNFSRELRESEDTTNVLVLMTWAKCPDYTVSREISALFEREGRPYITKPFNPIELLTLIKEMLDPDERRRLRAGSRIF